MVLQRLLAQAHRGLSPSLDSCQGPEPLNGGIFPVPASMPQRHKSLSVSEAEKHRYTLQRTGASCLVVLFRD
eukprot:1645660-Amphidinium_carterae.1